MSMKENQIALLKSKQEEESIISSSIRELASKRYDLEMEIDDILGKLIFDDVLTSNKVWTAKDSNGWFYLYCETNYAKWNDFVPANSIGKYLRWKISENSDGDLLYENGEVQFNFDSLKSFSEFVLKNNIKISEASFLEKRISLKEELYALDKMIASLGLEIKD